MIRALPALPKSWPAGSVPSPSLPQRPCFHHPTQRTVPFLPPRGRSRLSSHREEVQVVLVHPQIPQNTGNIARTCAATNIALHLVKPLGFSLDDRKLKRAGLDYWPSVCVRVHDSWQDFFSFFQQSKGPRRLVAFSVLASQYYAAPEFKYQRGDWLVFGAETSGLPAAAHADVASSGGQLVKIPIQHTHVRSLNLAVSAAVGVFEALRQLDLEGHVVEPRGTTEGHVGLETHAQAIVPGV